MSLGTHLGEFATLSRSLEPGAIGSVLLLVTQLAYLPNAILWAIAYTLGPGFAFGAGTMVTPTGAALGQLPAFPLLAALPPGTHAHPGLADRSSCWRCRTLAGCAAGLLLVRAAPTPALEAAPLWGLACGAAAGGVLGILAAFSGGPLGNGRLAAVGPSGWQVGAVAALEIGIASAVTAGVANWLRMGGRASVSAATSGRDLPWRLPRPRPTGEDTDSGHTIYVDPWAGDEASRPEPTPRGPAEF